MATFVFRVIAGRITPMSPVELLPMTLRREASTGVYDHLGHVDAAGWNEFVESCLNV